MRHAVKQHHHRQNSFGKRQNNAKEHADVRAAVQHGGFIQFIRYVCLKKGPHDDQVIGGNGPGQNHGPDGVVHVQVPDQQVGGNHSAGKVHGEDDQEHQQIAQRQILP
ncbi:hypothetical protein D3C75_952820 [compost metagenome]